MTNYQKLGRLNQQKLLSQFWRLKAHHQGICRTMLPLKVVEKKLLLPLPRFWQLPGSSAFLGLQLHHAHLCLQQDMAFLFPNLPAFSPTKTLIIELQPHPSPGGPLLNYAQVQRLYVQLKSHSEVQGRHEFWQTLLKPLQPPFIK